MKVPDEAPSLPSPPGGRRSESGWSSSRGCSIAALVTGPAMPSTCKAGQVKDRARHTLVKGSARYTLEQKGRGRGRPKGGSSMHQGGRRDELHASGGGGGMSYLHGRWGYMHERGGYMHGRGGYMHEKGATCLPGPHSPFHPASSPLVPPRPQPPSPCPLPLTPLPHLPVPPKAPPPPPPPSPLLSGRPAKPAPLRL